MARSIYAFTGKRGSGKSTAAEALVDIGFTDIKFADPLKNMMRALYRTCGLDSDMIERKLEGDLKEIPCEWLGGKTPRFAMQTLGTEWRDMIDTHLWSNIFIKRVEGMGPNARVVCSDYRFPGHETDALNYLQAKKIRVNRVLDTDGDAYSQHASETSIDKLPVDMVLHNDGSIDDLREWIIGLYEVQQILQDTRFIDDIVRSADAA